MNTAGTVTASGNANSSATGQQINPRVAVDPDGAPSTGAVAFTAVWEDIQTGTPATVKAAGYTGPTTRAWEVTASQTTGQHHNPDVAVSASGDAVVVWDEDGDADASYNVGLIRLARTNGAATLSRRVANSTTGGQQTHASVAANFNGDFAVAWESDHTGTAGAWTRSFDSTGAARYADVQVAAGGKAPSVGIDDQSQSVVGWTVQAATLDVWVRGFGTNGTDTGRLSVAAAQLPPRGSPGADDGRGLAVRRSGGRLHRRQRRQHLRPGHSGHGNLQQQLVNQRVAGDIVLSTASPAVTTSSRSMLFSGIDVLAGTSAL